MAIPKQRAAITYLSDPAPHYRSGAVARMVRMPVSTLRVWERRYGLTRAELSASGQRLYLTADVQRLALLKQLTDRGHAIGSLAALDMQQLLGVAATHANALAAAQTGVRTPAISAHIDRAWRVAVVGPALSLRLRRPELLRRLQRPLQWLGPYGDATQAAAALKVGAVDALLFHEPTLQAGWLAATDAAAPALRAVPKAVLYRFAAEPVCEGLATAGVALLREPQTDGVLGQWLQDLLARTVATPAGPRDLSLPGEPPVPRRWDDAGLADFAGLSSTIACECPRHVAELLMQLSHFETYSAECEQRSPADAELHAYLNRVAAASRAQFEAALERVALHEGLLLPS